MNDNFNMYGLIRSEIRNRYYGLLYVSKINQDGIDCRLFDSCITNLVDCNLNKMHLPEYGPI